MAKLSTGIVDDHPLFVEGLSTILSNFNNIEVVFRGATGGALRNFLSSSALDLLFLDISLGSENGIELVKNLKIDRPSLRVIILSTHQPGDIGLDMSTFRGNAYILKISGRKILEDAIHHVVNGKFYSDPGLTFPSYDQTQNPFRLTKREYEIIELIRQGHTSREIADMLYLSELTIKTHRRNISDKLNSRNVADMLNKIPPS
jgi:DNA-binding NarL/FixJ family response regulator